MVTSLTDVVILTFSDWKVSHDATYGNCFSFNYNMTTEYISYRAGKENGLLLLIQGSQADYICSSQSAGD